MVNNSTGDEGVLFDLKNPREQSITFVDDDGSQLTYTLGPEQSIVIAPLASSGNIYLANGNFDRRLSVDDGLLFTLSARVKGSVNPYTSTLTSISEGSFRSNVGSLHSHGYKITSKTGSNVGYAAGYYEATYTLNVLGTHCQRLVVNLYPGGRFYYVKSAIW